MAGDVIASGAGGLRPPELIAGGVGPSEGPTSMASRRALVFAAQPHASAFVAPAADVVPVPDEVPTAAAALLAHMETAVNLVLDGAPLLGERVVVLGQGTVGLLVTALLARFPLQTLVVVEA